jgi:hypothetical protein
MGQRCIGSPRASGVVRNNWIRGWFDESTVVRGMMGRDCHRSDRSAVARGRCRRGRARAQVPASLEVENLVLRRQLGLFKERGVQPGRIDAATRVSLALLSQLCDWRSCLMVVRPETVIRWHRVGWRLLWR